MTEYTPNFNLKKPAPEDFYNIQDFNDNMDKLDAGAVKKGSGIAELSAGTLAARPAAGIAGRYYFAQDTGEIYFDTGTEWVLAAASSAELAAHLADTTTAHGLENKSDKGTPEIYIVSEGFPTGWSGTIRWWKNQENLVTLHVNLYRPDNDISSSIVNFYTLPEGFRPNVASVFQVVHFLDINGNGLANSLGEVVVINFGTVKLAPFPSTSLTNARSFAATFNYYCA